MTDNISGDGRSSPASSARLGFGFSFVPYEVSRAQLLLLPLFFYECFRSSGILSIFHFGGLKIRSVRRSSRVVESMTAAESRDVLRFGLKHDAQDQRAAALLAPCVVKCRTRDCVWHISTGSMLYLDERDVSSMYVVSCRVEYKFRRQSFLC